MGIAKLIARMSSLASRIQQVVKSDTAPLRRLAALGATKRRLRQQLLCNCVYLRKGLWFLFEPRIARHCSVRMLPKSLAYTKSVGRPNRTWVSVFLKRIVYLSVPPSVVRLRRGAHQYSEPALRTDYKLAISAKAGDIILIDSNFQEIVRVSDRSIVDKPWIDLRRRLGKFVTLPSFEIVGGGMIVKERFLQGDPFLCLGTPSRVTVALQLAQQYEALTASDCGRAPSGFWEEVLEYVMGLPLPAAAKRWIDLIGDDFALELRQFPFTPAHGDLSANNIIITQQGPALIDLEDCAFLPAFFDLFFLCHQEHLAGREDIWNQLIAGSGWEAIDRELNRANGYRNSPSKTIWILGAFFAECYLWQRKVGAKALNVAILAEWWDPIEQLTLNGAR